MLSRICVVCRLEIDICHVVALRGGGVCLKKSVFTENSFVNLVGVLN